MKLGNALILIITLMTLTACGSTRYAGKVVPGSVGRPIIVSDNDDRINNNAGIPGLEVTLYNQSSSGHAPSQIARTTTDDEGKFSISIPSAETPRGTVLVRVTGDEIYSARSKVYLPRQGQLMLFTVVTRDEPDSTTAEVDPSSIDPGSK